MRNTGFSLREQTLLCAKGAAPLWTPKSKAPTSWAWGSLRSLGFWTKTQKERRRRSRGFGGAKPPSEGVAKQGIDPVICSMATNYLATRTGTAGTGAGGKHAAYISGLDRHADKTEVQAVIDKNIPASVARDGLKFFKKADELERANGRSYRSLIIAIPREATDKTAWAQTFTDDLLKDKHAYRLAIHDKGDGNPHAHLMFSERGLKEGQTAKDFFSRKNPKPTYATSKKESADWLKNAKALYLTHVQKVAPDYVPTPKGEPKIGPKLKNASAAFEAKRADREKTVHGIRRTETELVKFDKELVDYKTRFAFDHFKPRYEKAQPKTQAKIKQQMRVHISKPNKDGSPKTIQQILEELEQAITRWLQDMARQAQHRAQQAHAQLMEAERQRLAAHGGIPSPFDFRPSSSWGRAAQAQTQAAPTRSTRHKP
jgi:hypothetical protein